jgi:hypothetical protein
MFVWLFFSITERDGIQSFCSAAFTVRIRGWALGREEKGIEDAGRNTVTPA